MAESRVVDTNVLIVSSAADDGSPFRPDNTPVEEAALRNLVLTWLHGFEKDPERLVVLDYQWLILGEYQNRLDVNQDYGWQAIMAKYNRDEVVWVELTTDANGHALLPGDLANAVTDRTDRKMVAAVLEAMRQEHACRLTNACDSDWLDCADTLAIHRVEVEHLLEEWLHRRQNARRHGA